MRVRRRDLDAWDLVQVDGIWCTDRPLTALETAAERLLIRLLRDAALPG